jgi:hypothetical protein
MKLLKCLEMIVDPRRAQGRLYALAPLLFISVLAVLSGANSYRKIARFIDAHRLRLNDWLGLEWERAPAHTAIRYAFLKLSPEAPEVAKGEAAFRAHSAALAAASDPLEDCIAVDGKTLKGSFDAPSIPQGRDAGGPSAQRVYSYPAAHPRPSRHPGEVQRDPGRPATHRRVGATGAGLHAGRRALSKKTFEVAQATGNPLIVQVKGNQPTLLKQVKALAREAPALSTLLR